LALTGSLVLAALAPAIGRAQEAAGAGKVIRVPNPITSEARNRIREVTKDTLERFEAEERQRDPKDRRTFKLIFDFNPDDRPSNTPEFADGYGLAQEISQLKQKGVQTIAYVHGTKTIKDGKPVYTGGVTRHSVLPVLACQEIVFSSEATLGHVVARPDQSLSEAERRWYEEVAKDRFPLAIVRKMYDRNLVVVKKLVGQKGDLYRDQRDEPTGEEILRGDPALYTFAQAREYGLCQPQPRETIAQLVEDYQLPRSSLLQDPLLGRTPVVWRIEVAGPINGELKEKLKRRIDRCLGQKANLIVLELTCGGGDADVAYELGDYLAKLNDNRPDNPVKTVAYVTEQARDTAIFLAMGCNQIVMNKMAKLGGFERYLQSHQSQAKAIRENLEELATRQWYSPLLARGMLDRDVRLHWVSSTGGTSQTRLMTEEDLDKDRATGKPQWQSEWRVKPAKPEDEGKVLTLNADTARKLGLARDVVDDLDSVYRREGVSPAQVQTVGADLLDDLVEFLCHPWTSVFLVMLGITCLFLELKMPGVSLPGIVAALCFVLFFWSHSHLRGQVDWLAMLLFALGLVLIALEIFVLPGIGVAGFTGIILALGSLGLVAYGHLPRTEEDWVAYGKALSPFGVSLVGAVVAALLLARYLPSVPFANRLFLKPASETAELGEEAPTAVPTELSALLGAIGVAATPLRPAGKAQFGDDFVDVVADGGYVPSGTRVQVIEVEGNRVVVKEV
jgi:membrane-bound ClpP family serine protease